MASTTPAAAAHAAHGARPSILPAVHAGLRTARTYASSWFHRFVKARIATECGGPVRPLSRRRPWPGVS